MNKVTTCLLLFASLLIGCRDIDGYEKEQEQIVSNDLGTEVRVPQNFPWQGNVNLTSTVVFSTEQAHQSGLIQVLDANHNAMLSFWKKEGQSEIEIAYTLSALNDSLFVYSRTMGILRSFPSNATLLDVSIATEKKSKTESDFFKSNQNNCSSDCDVEITGSENNLQVEENQTYCLTGSITGNLTLKNGSTLKICGQANINNINAWGSNQTIIVSEEGRLTINNLNINSEIFITNYGTIEASSGVSNNEYLANHGTITCGNNFNINSGAFFDNTGTISIGNGLNINANATNSGTISSNGKSAINGGISFTNNCQLIVGGNLDINGALINNAYCSVTGKTTVNGGSSSQFNEGSILWTKDFTLNSGNLSSTGTGVVVVDNKTVVNGGAKTITGILDICDANGIETFYSSHTTSFTYCEKSVAESSCISQGIEAGNEEIEEAVAFSYPSSNWNFRAFEDLWPSKGDYDFNDVVLKYKLNFEADKDNNITQVTALVIVNALGGSLRNGIALQFLHADKSRYFGNLFTVVQGEHAKIDPQDPSVVILNNNIIDNLGSGFYNNMGEGYDANPRVYEISISLNAEAGVKSTDLIPDLFLYRSSDRGLEMHMPYMPPSMAANLSNFNTFEDDSKNTGYYLSHEGYPWVIEVSDCNVFYHPRSKVNLVDAYPDFVTWVESNGTSNKTWYENPVMKLVY